MQFGVRCTVLEPGRPSLLHQTPAQQPRRWVETQKGKPVDLELPLPPNPCDHCHGRGKVTCGTCQGFGKFKLNLNNL
jgi:hypothetical protein